MWEEFAKRNFLALKALAGLAVFLFVSVIITATAWSAYNGNHWREEQCRVINYALFRVANDDWGLLVELAPPGNGTAGRTMSAAWGHDSPAAAVKAGDAMRAEGTSCYSAGNASTLTLLDRTASVTGPAVAVSCTSVLSAAVLGVMAWIAIKEYRLRRSDARGAGEYTPLT